MQNKDLKLCIRWDQKETTAWFFNASKTKTAVFWGLHPCKCVCKYKRWLNSWVFGPIIQSRSLTPQQQHRPGQVWKDKLEIINNEFPLTWSNPRPSPWYLFQLLHHALKRWPLPPFGILMAQHANGQFFLFWRLCCHTVALPLVSF